MIQSPQTLSPSWPWWEVEKKPEGREPIIGKQKNTLTENLLSLDAKVLTMPRKPRVEVQDCHSFFFSISNDYSPWSLGKHLMSLPCPTAFLTVLPNRWEWWGTGEKGIKEVRATLVQSSSGSGDEDPLHGGGPMHPSNPFPSSQPFYLNHKLPGFKTMGSFKKMAVFSFSILLILIC